MLLSLSSSIAKLDMQRMSPAFGYHTCIARYVTDASTLNALCQSTNSSTARGRKSSTHTCARERPFQLMKHLTTLWLVRVSVSFLASFLFLVAFLSARENGTRKEHAESLILFRFVVITLDIFRSQGHERKTTWCYRSVCLVWNLVCGMKTASKYIPYNTNTLKEHDTFMDIYADEYYVNGSFGGRLRWNQTWSNWFKLVRKVNCNIKYTDRQP